MTTVNVQNVSQRYINDIAPGAASNMTLANAISIFDSPPGAAGMLTQDATTNTDPDMAESTTTTGAINIAAATDTSVFTITGGRVRIKLLAGELTEATDATTNTGQFKLVDVLGPTTTAMCTTTSVASKGIGTVFGLPAAPGSALLVGTTAASFAGSLGGIEFFVDNGTIKFTTSGASATGKAKFTCVWIPVDTGARVIALG